MDNNNNVETFLAHYGKVGMKWGRRNSSGLSSYGSEVTVFTGGLRLGKKTNFTNPEALKLRTIAGKKRTESLLLSVGSVAALSAAKTTRSPFLKGFLGGTSAIWAVKAIVGESQSVARGVEARYVQNKKSK